MRSCLTFTLFLTLCITFPAASFAETEAELKAGIVQTSEALKKDPKNALAYSARGYCYLGLKNLDEAEKDLLKAVSLDPKDKGSLIQLSYLYILRKEYEKALSQVRKAIKLGDQKVSTYNIELACLSSGGHPLECLRKCDALLKRFPDDSDALYYRALSKQELRIGSDKDIFSDFSEAVRLDPTAECKKKDFESFLSRTKAK